MFSDKRLTSMTHPPPRRRRYPCNEAHSRFILGIITLQKLRCVLFRRTSYLAYHDDSVRFFVFQEDFETIDEVCPREWIASDADDEGLAEAGLGGLVDGFVGEGAGAGDDAYAAALVDESGHDADFALTLECVSKGLGDLWMMRAYRGNNARTVGAHEPCFALGLEDVCDTDHIFGSSRSVMRQQCASVIIPCCGIPSVMLSLISSFLTPSLMHTHHTTNGISASMASSIPFAANGGLSQNQCHLSFPSQIVCLRDEDR